MDFVSWVFDLASFPHAYDLDKPLLIDASNPSRFLSFNQLRTLVRQVVAGLKAAGIQPGDCVCVNSFNDIYYNVLYLGIIAAGARFTGVNPAYSHVELTHHMLMTNVKAMFVEPHMLSQTLTAADEFGLPTSSIFVFDVHSPNPREDLSSWETLLQHGESDFVPCHSPDSTIASYQTSSGTSGLPKAAMIPHSYLISQAKLRISGPLVNYEVRRLTALPPMHVFATPIVPASIREGCEVYIMRRYEMESFIRAIKDFRISETYLPPPPLIAIPKSPVATKEAMASIRQIWMGGAGVRYANQLPFYSILHPDARINQCWGMTEVGWVTQIKWPHKQQDDSVGTPLDGFKVRIVDDDGNVIRDPCARGELQILAPHPMLGYLNNTNATDSAFTRDKEGTWINSGDVGRIDQNGNVSIVDRKKDLIKVRGWQVSPAEVESTLLQHVDVVDVAVIGLPLPDGQGEFVRAYVVLRAGRKPAPADLKAFAQQSLSKYKCPEEIVFTDVIPKNPTGKILRRILREQATGPPYKLASLSSANPSLVSVNEENANPSSEKGKRKRRGCFGNAAAFFQSMFDCSSRSGR